MAMNRVQGIGSSVLADYLWAIFGRREPARRVAHRVAQRFRQSQ